MAWIESTDMNAAGGDHLPTAAQMRAEVWMTLVHGARGFGYFCHIFKPSFVEGGLLATSSTKAAATAINAEVTSLAPALNEPSVANWGTVASSVGTTPIDVMVKRHGGATWLFAVAMRPDATTGTFQLDRIPATASAEVLGESRTLTVSGGSFQDAFAGYAVHLYKITY
jgi:hypothetical protein